MKSREAGICCRAAVSCWSAWCSGRGGWIHAHDPCGVGFNLSYGIVERQRRLAEPQRAAFGHVEAILYADAEFAGDVDAGFVREAHAGGEPRRLRSEEHTSELQSLMRISYAVFCLKKKTK